MIVRLGLFEEINLGQRPERLMRKQAWECLNEGGKHPGQSALLLQLSSAGTRSKVNEKLSEENQLCW